MDEQTYIIRFNNVSLANANLYAQELRDALLDASPKVKVDRRREDPRTQDPGSILILFLGAPAVVAVAKAFGNWLQLRNSASVTLEDSDGKVIAKDLSSKDAARITELFINKQ